MQINDFPLERVPESSRVSFFSVAIVHMGMLTALDQFMLGAVLGDSMTLSAALTAILVGSLLFGLITFGFGYIGMKEGLSGSLLARWCGFGRTGSALIGVVVAISLLGWFGIQNAIFAKSLSTAFSSVLSFQTAATISGLFLTTLVAFGFKALRFTARIAVPVFVALIAWISWQTLATDHVHALAVVTPGKEMLSVNAGITLVVGGAILASLMTPDLTRYSRKGSHVFGVTLATIILGEFIINGLAIFIARKLNTGDVMSIITLASGTAGLFAVIFSTLRVNDLNLYSSALGIINAVESLSGIKLKYRHVTLLLGVLGTTLSVLGILDHFVDFLNLLGVIVPPALGVMLTEYFWLKKYSLPLRLDRHDGRLPEETIFTGWPAIIATLLGGYVGLNVLWGVSTINSFIVACVGYVVLETLAEKVIFRRPKKA
ncbi:cytosine permease [Erwinia phyllosphaerae]|uniref:cytosine permease n=1 Tax=Erwinia phyllosphaerae TaxID=2853256 RepID=UPI001FEEDFEE|nr:cytosine permease [Erwinia phyllosphaerae]MBV4368492.1 cytosine permease [Erwinia phyllosphaerae]